MNRNPTALTLLCLLSATAHADHHCPPKPGSALEQTLNDVRAQLFEKPEQVLKSCFSIARAREDITADAVKGDWTETCTTVKFKN